MDTFTEFLLIFTNAAIIVTNVGLMIVTGMDHQAMARIAALAISKISPRKVVQIERQLKAEEKPNAQHNS